MAKTKTELVLEEGESRPKGQDLILRVADPTIEEFEAAFKKRGGGTGLVKFEREILRAFLWWQLEEQ